MGNFKLRGDEQKLFSSVRLNDSQKELHHGIRASHLTIVRGPAGTAKTFTACYAALKFLLDGTHDTIIVTKQLVQSGENMGFLKGTKEEKMEPFFESFISTFKKLVGTEKAKDMKFQETIRTLPLNFMRGDTYDNAIMILDEAQNCNWEQIMLWATRMGKNSKLIMLGDTTQRDVKPRDSNYEDFIRVFKDMDGVYYHQFERADIVRNPFIISLVDRYEDQVVNK